MVTPGDVCQVDGSFYKQSKHQCKQKAEGACVCEYVIIVSYWQAKLSLLSLSLPNVGIKPL